MQVERSADKRRFHTDGRDSRSSDLTTAVHLVVGFVRSLSGFILWLTGSYMSSLRCYEQEELIDAE